MRLALKLPLSGKKRLPPKTRPVRREYLPRTERFIRTKGLLPTENLLLHPMPRRNVHTEQRIWFHSAKRLVVHATKRFISVRDQGGVASLVRIPQAPASALDRLPGTVRNWASGRNNATAGTWWQPMKARNSLDFMKNTVLQQRPLTMPTPLTSWRRTIPVKARKRHLYKTSTFCPCPSAWSPQSQQSPPINPLSAGQQKGHTPRLLYIN